MDEDADPTGKATSFAGGILLKASQGSVVDRRLFAGNRRTGILVDSSSRAAVTRSLLNAITGAYGLVVRHTKDARDQANAVFGATIQNRGTDAGLAVPASPLAAHKPQKSLP